MPQITFTSDLGKSDHYVMEVKLAILSRDPAQKIVDITHVIQPHDIGHAAYVVRHVYSSFPEGTVHLIAVDPFVRWDMSLVAVLLNGHYFVSYDSGIYNLIHSGPPSQVIELNHESPIPLSRLNLALAASRIAKGEALSSLGSPKMDLQIRINRQVKVTKKEIVGQVIHIDYFGNLITNIHRSDFETIVKLLGGNPSILIRFGQKKFSQFHQNYNDVEEKEYFVLFNSYGFVEIGRNKRRASDHPNLRMESPVFIEFNS